MTTNAHEAPQADLLTKPVSTTAPDLRVPALPPDQDDIADPPVPDTVSTVLQALQEMSTPAPPPPRPPEWSQHEALLQGFLGHLLHRLDGELIANGKELLKTVDSMGMAVKGWVEAFAGHNEHATYQLSAALDKLHERGLALRHDPYQASVQALSPHGYPVTISVAKQDVQELIGALPALVGWLAQEGYKPVG